MNLGHGRELGEDTSVAAMERRAHGVLDAAWSAGIRYLDVARSYGRGEEFVASWIAARGIAPDAVVVGSKWGYTYTADWKVEAPSHEVKDHGLATFERQWRESRGVLGEHLDLYQIHSATLETGVLTDARVLRALAARRAEGVAIGLSVTGANQGDVIRSALAVEVDGLPLFQSVQASWNLLETSAGQALAEAHSAGLGVIVKEGMANGRLATRDADPAFAAQDALLDRWGARLGCPRDALALAAVLAQPWVDVVLSGAASAEQLGSNLRALDVEWSEEASAELAALAEAPARYWSTRAALPWN
ncbi:MAG: aldo/keto reductase [Deltaproteobacteria bacterium]|nr:aldo/keto reductase [Deltaproteobacteria bacterium]